MNDVIEIRYSRYGVWIHLRVEQEDLGDCTCLLQLRPVLEKMFVTVPTYPNCFSMSVLVYFNFQQCQSMNDAGPMTSYSMPRNTEHKIKLHVLNRKTKLIVTAHDYSKILPLPNKQGGRTHQVIPCDAAR